MYHSCDYPSYFDFHCDNPLRPAKLTQTFALITCDERNFYVKYAQLRYFMCKMDIFIRLYIHILRINKFIDKRRNKKISLLHRLRYTVNVYFYEK